MNALASVETTSPFLVSPPSAPSPKYLIQNEGQARPSGLTQPSRLDFVDQFHDAFLLGRLVLNMTTYHIQINFCVSATTYAAFFSYRMVVVACFGNDIY